MTDVELNGYERKKIEMEFAVPLIRHLQKELGTDAVSAALKSWTRNKTTEARQNEADPSNEMEMKDWAEAMEEYRACGWEYDITELTDRTFSFNVTSCKFTEMMVEMDARDLGPNLICNHDFSGALDTGVQLARSKTLMKGCEHCNFSFAKR